MRDKQLADVDLDIVYSSPLKELHETACGIRGRENDIMTDRYHESDLYTENVSLKEER